MKPIRYIGRALDRAPGSRLFPLAATLVCAAAVALVWLLLVVTGGAR